MSAEQVPARAVEVYARRPPSLAERAYRAHQLEVRDPQAATMPVKWWNPELAQVPDWNADAAFRLGYAANVIAYRCVQIRASAVARIPLVAGRKLGDYKTVREDAPIARLLGPPPGRPAPKLSARKLIRWTIAQEIVTGRRAWEIETANGEEDGVPVAFWPLAAGKLEAHESKGGTEWFRLFTYGQPGAPDRVRLKPGFVFYGWDPSGNDFRQAASAFQVARYDLSLVTMSDRYGLSFLRNNAVPAAIVTTNAFPNDKARRSFRRQWEAELGGPDNAGRVLFNEAGEGDGPVSDAIHVQTLGLSAKDARLVEQRKDAMLEIAIGLGVPWSKLDASGRTFDNAEAEDRTFYEETVLEDLQDLQDDINMQLAPRLGDEVVWFDLRTVRALRRRRFAIGSAAEAFDRGAITQNEWREDLELDAVDGGDEMPVVGEERSAIEIVREYAEMLQKIYLAVGVVITPEEARELLDRAGADLPPMPELLALSPGEATAAVERAAGRGETRDPAGRENRAPDPEEIEARRASLWRAADAAATSVETRWVRALRRLFARQAEATIARLTGKRGRQALRDPAGQVDPESIFSRAFWTGETRELLVDLYEQAAGAALDRLVALFAIAFDIEAPWVQEYITTRANRLAGQVTTTTYEAITRQLAEGVAAGESIDDLADRIRHVFDVADRTRAVTIARTEVISAYNGAQVAGGEQLPADVVAGFEWIATRDSRTRDSHAGVDGQVVARGQPFNVGGHEAAYPGDPALPAGETVNCRCAVVALTPEEMAEALERAPAMVEVRRVRAVLDLVTESTDLLAVRRALVEVAA